MELSFKKNGSVYSAEFQVDGDFALHVEKGKGSLNVYQRSVETGEYDVVRGIDVNVNDTCVDVDIVGVVFPKWIKVESNIMPTRAVVTTGAGVEVGYSEAQIADVLNTPV